MGSTGGRERNYCQNGVGCREREAWALDLCSHCIAFSFQPNTQGFGPGTKFFCLAVIVSSSSLSPINPLSLLPIRSLAGGSILWMVQLWLDHFQGPSSRPCTSGSGCTPAAKLLCSAPETAMPEFQMQKVLLSSPECMHRGIPELLDELIKDL